LRKNSGEIELPLEDAKRNVGESNQEYEEDLSWKGKNDWK
jgi:hypothetical protein